MKGKNRTEASRAFLCYNPPHSVFLLKEHISSFILSFSGLKCFSLFSLDVKAYALPWHYTAHGICPERRLMGASLAMRSQSR